MKKFLCAVMLCVVALTVSVEAFAWGGEAAGFPGVMVAAARTKKKAPAKKKAKTATKKQMSPLEKAANEGNAQAQYELAESYLLGKNGMKVNNREALKWYRRAAEQGHAMSQYTLGGWYNEETGINPDGKQSVAWYRKAKISLRNEAERGNAEAARCLGLIYELGGADDGIDEKEAVKWYSQAAYQGDAQAQAELGRCYQSGHGVKQDYKQALDWYRKSAEKNNASGLEALGRCYLEGIGVKQNFKQAADYSRKACLADGDYYEDEYREAERFYRKKDYQNAAMIFLGALEDRI